MFAHGTSFGCEVKLMEAQASNQGDSKEVYSNAEKNYGDDGDEDKRR